MDSTAPRRSKRRYALGALVILCALLVYSFLGATDTTPAQQELEKQFQESMAGVVLKGHFTVNGREGLREETYTIEKVTQMPGDYWLFHARIQYGGKDVTVPVPVKLLWAGDTAVVSLTDATIPGLGTFTGIRRAGEVWAEDEEWCRTPVDRFVISKMREEGLAPSREADRRTLPDPGEIPGQGFDTTGGDHNLAPFRLLVRLAVADEIKEDEQPGAEQQKVKQWFF